MNEIEIDESGLMFLRGKSGYPLARIHFDGVGIDSIANRKYVLERLNGKHYREDDESAEDMKSMKLLIGS